MRDYRKINAWQLADDLAVEIYRVTAGYPKEELYGLVSQIRRAAVSVAANIAEGSARGTNRDYLHFLYIARASLTETQYLVHLSSRLGYIPPELAEALEQQLKRTFGCLHGLIETVARTVGALRKIIATGTSLLTICIARLLSTSPVAS